jgi:DNA-binding PadR family transcriptional regulator
VSADPRNHLPLKDLVFRILLVLAEGERHGANLAQALEEPSGGARVLPGQFYRTLDRMLEDGLIEEREPSAAFRSRRQTPGAAPRRFFRLTTLGREVTRAETRRLEALIARSRDGRLLKGRR